MQSLPKEYEEGRDSERVISGVWNALQGQNLFIGFCYGRLQKLRNEVRRIHAELTRAGLLLTNSQRRERELEARCKELEESNFRLSCSAADALARIRELEEGSRESEFVIEAAAGIVQWYAAQQRQGARLDS